MIEALNSFSKGDVKRGPARDEGHCRFIVVWLRCVKELVVSWLVSLMNDAEGQRRASADCRRGCWLELAWSGLRV